MERRSFLKAYGVRGGCDRGWAGGDPGGRRAPAYAQMRKLHILQFVDFVPEGMRS
jgi:hypothetical protein